MLERENRNINMSDEDDDGNKMKRAKQRLTQQQHQSQERRRKKDGRNGKNTVNNTEAVVRRFPGPAGALPILTEDTDLNAPLQNQAHLSAANKKKAASFNSPAWQSMLAQSSKNAWNGVRKENIAHILAEGRFGKIKYLAVMVRSINKTHRDASVVVSDQTGSLKGCLHPNVLQELDEELLVSGAVLVLKQVSVFSPAPRRHYLNITARNIITIFSPDGTKTVPCQQNPPTITHVSPSTITTTTMHVSSPKTSTTTTSSSSS
eukprot:m.92553 g.92553  ORF g.92553 m.92553 type:complete len:262 (-) comp8893_c5_seq1:3574-4359(-)